MGTEGGDGNEAQEVDPGAQEEHEEEEGAISDETPIIDDSMESSKPKLAFSPYEPSRQERAEHNVTHCPFRAWCRHCVAGKAVSSQHVVTRGKSEDESRVPILGMDYAFMSNAGEMSVERSEVKVLVLRDSRSKYLFTIPVPQKGLDDREWAVRRVVQAVDFLGYSNIMMKCDQENSLKAVISFGINQAFGWE